MVLHYFHSITYKQTTLLFQMIESLFNHLLIVNSKVKSLKKIIAKTSRLSTPSFYRYYRSAGIFTNQFGGLPHPSGDFLPNSDIKISPSVKVTPYGYLARDRDASFTIRPPLREPHQTLCKIDLHFTCLPVPQTPKLEFLNKSGTLCSETLDLRITSAHSAEALIEIPLETHQIRIRFHNQACLFSVHSISITALTNLDLAKGDLDDTKSKHRAIVCFPVIDWSFRIQRPQHLLRELAKNGDHICYLSTGLHGYGEEKVIDNPVEDRVNKISIPGNPRLNLYKHTPSYRSIEIGCKAITSFLLERGFEDVILIVHLPFWLPYAKKLQKERGYPIVYDCMDDHKGFENNSIEMLKAESELKKCSDLLITSSQLLYEEGIKEHTNCKLIRNAGNPAHFSQVIKKNDAIIGPFTKPVIGYFGAIAEWFDVEAIKFAASEKPDWIFVLIGQYPDGLKEELASLTNIMLLGEIHYDYLPRYLTTFNVCTIPFRRIPLTEATNPVKLYEYFATGKPVVARRLPEIEMHEDCTYLYESPVEFITKLEQALEEDANDSKVEKRKDVAALNTWKRRGESLNKELSSLQKKVSIIVISYEALPYLRECLSSILQNTSYKNYEVIVVDNASSKPVVEYLKATAEVCPKIKLILNEENKGFAAANNQGLALAKDSDYFVLLNNDTVVPSGWLERLVYYASQEELGLIGPVTNCTGNEAKIKTNYRSLKEMGQVSWGLRNQYQGEFFDINVAAMFCVAFRKEIFDKVGYLDESFGIGMFEDDDYAHRIRAEGYRVVCVEDVFVHHYGSVSFNQLPNETYQELFSENKAVYEKKWGSWKPHTYR